MFSNFSIKSTLNIEKQILFHKKKGRGGGTQINVINVIEVC